MAGAKAQLDRFANAADRLGGTLRKVGLAGVAGVSAVTLAYSKEQDQLTKVATNTGKTLENIRSKYQAAARGIAKDTGVPLGQVYDAFRLALSAGQENAAAIDLVTRAAKGQAAGIGAVGDTVSSATTTMKLYAKTAEEAINQQIRASQLGEGSALDYGMAIKGLTQHAAAMRVPFDSLLASLALTAGATKSVSVAETQMVGFLSAMSKPAADAEEALAELSRGTVTFGDMLGALPTHGIEGVVGTLKTMLAGVDPVRGAQLIARLFPEREARAFFNTVEQGDLAAFRAEIGAAEGTLEEEFGKGATLLSRQFAQAREQVKALASDIGETLAPTIRELVGARARLADMVPRPVAGNEDVDRENCSRHRWPYRPGGRGRRDCARGEGPLPSLRGCGSSWSHRGTCRKPGLSGPFGLRRGGDSGVQAL